MKRYSAKTINGETASTTSRGGLLSDTTTASRMCWIRSNRLSDMSKLQHAELEPDMLQANQHNVQFVRATWTDVSCLSEWKSRSRTKARRARSAAHAGSNRPTARRQFPSRARPKEPAYFVERSFNERRFFGGRFPTGFVVFFIFPGRSDEPCSAPLAGPRRGL